MDPTVGLRLKTLIINYYQMYGYNGVRRVNSADALICVIYRV